MSEVVALIERNGLALVEIVVIAWFIGAQVWPWVKTYANERLGFERERAKADEARLERWASVVQGSVEASRSMVTAMETLRQEMHRELRDIHMVLRDRYDLKEADDASYFDAQRKGR